MLSAAGEVDTVSRFRAGLRVDVLACAALGLTVFGWALLWAAALSIVPFVPPWVGAVIFLAGLLLIPVRWPRGPVAGGGK
jgi:hypothetical protein